MDAATALGLAISGIALILAILGREIRRLDHELERLRDWRHDVGDKPGFAAFEKLKEWDGRLKRCEEALNGFLKKHGPS